MTVKNTLKSIVLAGALASGIGGCASHPEYDYKGMIGNDSVEFESSAFSGNCLTVKKADGRSIEYIDGVLGTDLILDFVYITNNDGQFMHYGVWHKTEILVVQEAQKKFDSYLSQIKEKKDSIEKARISQGLEYLK